MDEQYLRPSSFNERSWATGPTTAHAGPRLGVTKAMLLCEDDRQPYHKANDLSTKEFKETLRV
jgi:hypothetical protein